jgi:hypothetical protein
MSVSHVANSATGPARGADLPERSLLRACSPAEGGAGASSIPPTAAPDESEELDGLLLGQQISHQRAAQLIAGLGVEE